ncbi:ABC1 kinase family protein [Enterococcus rivorum]|nr:AarF/UbiB family protein [Enterococcus rivorum]MBP2100214.1 ubiquinone biosynthesis protein [Enterococcus rivorum]
MTQLSTGKKEQKKKTSSVRFKEIMKVFLSYNVLPNIAKQEHPEKVREAFEELGPTFIKIGQMLSVRSDILTPRFIGELKKLQDNVKTDTFATVKQTIEEETHLKLTDIFETFEELPFASASMGQAHKATLKNGKEVAVKVQHPGIKEEINLDLSLFAKVLPLIKHIPESNVVDPKEIFLEIKTSLQNELNSLKEAENGVAFYKKNNGWEIIQTPIIYRDYCTEKVLVMEFMQGESIRKFVQKEVVSKESEERKQLKNHLGNVLVRNFVKQVFEDGFFHADPHPGNILVRFLEPNEEGYHAKNKVKDIQHKKEMKQGSIGFNYTEEQDLPPYRLVYLDFGMMGYLDETMIHKLTNVMDSLYGNNVKNIGRAILQLCNQIGPVDEEHFFEELAPLLDENYGASVGDLNLQTLFFRIIAICHQNNLQAPQEVTMLIKAIATFEGVIRELAPEISLIEIATPFAKKYFTEKIDWQWELKKAGIDLLYSAKAAPKIPSRVLDVLDDLSKGKSKINLELKKQNELMDRVERMMNRLVMGLILSALIIGSSMLVEFNAGLTSNFVSVLGMIGYAIALFAILFLAVDIWKKGRRKK